MVPFGLPSTSHLTSSSTHAFQSSPLKTAPDACQHPPYHPISAAPFPPRYISALLLSLNTMLHLELPHVNVLSKVDLLPAYGDLGESIKEWKKRKEQS
jgi:hypothetical protein